MPSAETLSRGRERNMFWSSLCVNTDWFGWVRFYVVSLVLAAANFLPLLAHSPLNHERIPVSTVYYLIACYLLSLPLVFEFILDAIVFALSSTVQQVSEPKSGYFILLISLFLPVFTVNGSLDEAESSHSVLFIDCFVSFLQCLVIIGQYEKLQFRTNGHWKSSGCIAVVLMFVASQVLMNVGVAFSPSDLNHQTQRLQVYIGLALACGIFAFLLHVALSKKYLLQLARSLYFNTESPTKEWKINDYVSIVLQCIFSVFFAFNFIGISIFLGQKYQSSRHLNAGVLMHIVFGLCVAILPGRVIRKNFMMLNEEMAIKDTFIRYVSHEIRSPLSTTSLGLNYLLDKLRAHEINLSEVLDVVQESVVTCELAMNTLNDFLMLDKIQSNMLEISPVARQASEFMMEATRPFTLQASSSNVELSCNVESFDGIVSRNVSVEIDSYKMNQVLRNLLSNAFKFTPSGGTITATMTIHEYTTEELMTAGLINGSTLKHCVNGRCNMVRYSVADSGCGISAENLPRLFGQYVQFDAAKLQGGKGSGLGLWLSKAIVEMHGGRIGARSEGEGKGCTFWFELPCEVNSACHDAANQRVSFVHSTLAASSSDSSSSVQPVFSLEQKVPKIPAVSTAMASNGHSQLDLESGIGESRELAAASGGSQKEVRQRQTVLVDLHNASSQHKKRSRVISKSESVKALKVLLVDDSAIARKMVERSLTAIDAVCTHAKHGREAVEKVQEAMTSGVHYDVILMDHFMPEMSGPEAVEVIRDRLQYKGVIMGVSGNGSADTEFEALLRSERINLLMVKPFNLDAFISFMRVNSDSKSSDGTSEGGSDSLAK